MGWYSLYRWYRTFRKSPSTNYISWYKQYLYEEWYNSLSEEDKSTEDDRIRRLRDEDNRKLRTALMNIGVMSSMIYGLGARASGRSRCPVYMTRDPRLDELSDAINKHMNSSGLM